MTRKHYAGMTIILSMMFFVLFFFYMPIEVDGYRPDNVVLLIINAGFLAVTAAIVIVFSLFVAVRKDYVKRHLSTFSRFRHLLFLMVKRDFVARYKRSVLGVMWSLLNPLMTMLVLTMVFSTLFRFDIPNFPVYLLSGQLIFNFFNESTNLAMNSIVSNAGIIRKIYVPKYIFPISRVLSSIVNLTFAFMAFLLVVFVTRAPIHWTILLVPIPILYTFMFSLGIGMLLSSLVVFFRDLTHIYGILTTFLMFMTPIFYPVSILPDNVFNLIHLNPMFHYVSYFRDLALYGVVPGIWANIICLGFALAALCCGLYVTISQQDKYILYL